MLSSKHVCYTTHKLASEASLPLPLMLLPLVLLLGLLLMLRLRVLVGTSMVVLRSRGLLLGSRVHEALSQLPNELPCARRLVPSISTMATTASTLTTTTEELVCETTKVAQWA